MKVLPIPDDPKTLEVLGEEVGRWWSGLDLAHRLHAHYLMRVEEKQQQGQSPALEPVHTLVIIAPDIECENGHSYEGPQRFMCFEHGPECVLLSALRDIAKNLERSLAGAIERHTPGAKDDRDIVIAKMQNRITRAETLLMSIRKKVENGSLKTGSQVLADAEQWITES